ncbi:hypothetical protein F4777DRAFT_527870 [Nemania sp. FL0916]|nr:hypothetical protein F4777DRAFT_527870 [Nemania sp. FL0916]
MKRPSAPVQEDEKSPYFPWDDSFICSQGHSYHRWCKQGELDIQSCERICQICRKTLASTTSLRKHIPIHIRDDDDLRDLKVLPGRIGRPKKIGQRDDGTSTAPSTPQPTPESYDEQPVAEIKDPLSEDDSAILDEALEPARELRRRKAKTPAKKKDSEATDDDTEANNETRDVKSETLEAEKETLKAKDEVPTNKKDALQANNGALVAGGDEPETRKGRRGKSSRGQKRADPDPDPDPEPGSEDDSQGVQGRVNAWTTTLTTTTTSTTTLTTLSPPADVSSTSQITLPPTWPSSESALGSDLLLSTPSPGLASPSTQSSTSMADINITGRRDGTLSPNRDKGGRTRQALAVRLREAKNSVKDLVYRRASGSG